MHNIINYAMALIHWYINWIVYIVLDSRCVDASSSSVALRINIERELLFRVLAVCYLY